LNNRQLPGAASGTGIGALEMFIALIDTKV